MELIINSAGGVKCLYDEAIDLAALGELHITRASNVEPDENGCWWSDMSPVGGPWCGPFEKRSEALAAERQWLLAHVLFSADRGHTQAARPRCNQDAAEPSASKPFRSSGRVIIAS